MPSSKPSRKKYPKADPVEQDHPEQNHSEQDLPFTTGMRIFGGVAWGTLTTLTLASILIVLPQVPRPWLWGILPAWVTLIAVGIGLQWSIARGACPTCGRSLVVPPMGKRCPQCRSYLKAVNRSIVKIT
ncbi:MAG: hypothetical protein MH252_21250 [Thermosynechococcaceae cyanobacterium MS004]|nr:hypothetical protein [Thermosynechococcaceae cyanobacterium MS004]